MPGRHICLLFRLPACKRTHMNSMFFYKFVMRLINDVGPEEVMLTRCPPGYRLKKYPNGCRDECPFSALNSIVGTIKRGGKRRQLSITTIVSRNDRSVRGSYATENGARPIPDETLICYCPLTAEEFILYFFFNPRSIPIVFRISPDSVGQPLRRLLMARESAVCT